MVPATVISNLISLVTLAQEATNAYAKITALMGSGQPVTDEQWATLLADRQIAQTLLAAAIARATVDQMSKPPA
jgi:hypothetical protein